MKIIFPLLMLLAFACEKAPDTQWKTIPLPNGCLVNAEGYYAAYTAQHSQDQWYWARILVIKTSKGDGVHVNAHVITVVQWGNALWAYDQVFGSRKITGILALRDSPKTLAAMWGMPGIDAYYQDP